MKKICILLLLVISNLTGHSQSGILDPSFGTDGIVITQVSGESNFGWHTVVQPDGKIIVVGYRWISGIKKVVVIRYNTDGTFDNSFADDGKLIISVGPDSSAPDAVVLQDDGKIVIEANVWKSPPNSYSYSALIRLNTDGSFDGSFGTDGIMIANYADTYYPSILITEDGKILLGGQTYNTISVGRFNSDGTLDRSFGTNGWFSTVFSSSVSGIAQMAFQNDGKIVMGAWAWHPASSYQMAAARINADGTLDNSFGNNGKVIFNIGINGDVLRGLGIQSDGKIVLGGHTYITRDPTIVSDFVVVRLNTNGDFDTTYGINGVATAQIVDEANYTTGMVIQADDKVVLAGWTENGFEADLAMVRFDTDGNLDATFGNGGKVSTDIDGRKDYGMGIAFQTDNKIILTGYSYPAGADDSAIVVARYTNYALGTDDYQNVEFRIYPNPAREQLTIEMSDASSIYQLEIIDMLGKKIYNTEIQGMGQIDVSALASGTYLVKLNSNSETTTIRFVKK